MYNRNIIDKIREAIDYLSSKMHSRVERINHNRKIIRKNSEDMLELFFSLASRVEKRKIRAQNNIKLVCAEKLNHISTHHLSPIFH